MKRENSMLIDGNVSINHVPCFVGLSEKNNKCLFTYPTVLDADYGQIFSDVFCADIADREYLQESKLASGDEKEKGFFQIRRKRAMIPIEDSSSGIILPMAVQLLVDLLFSKLLGDLSHLEKKPHTKGDNKRFESKKEIKGLLKFFQEKGFPYSQADKIRAMLDMNNLPFDKLDYSYLSEIVQKSTEDHLSIPYYSVTMFRVFELYAYSYLKKKNPDSNIEYQARFVFNDDPTNNEQTNSKRRDIIFPDIFMEDAERVYDAKYRFQYRSENYCELEDVDRMINYILYMKNQKKLKNPKGIFIYPDIRKCNEVKELNRKLRNVDKMGISFPIDVNRQRAWLKEELSEPILNRISSY